MRVLKHKDTPEPGVWRVGTPKVFREWRERRRENLLNTEGRVVRNEWDVAHHQGWERAESEDGASTVLEAPEKLKPEEPRVVVDQLTRDFINQMLWWAKYDPDTYMDRVRTLKLQGGLTHLSDEQAAEQIRDLCRKVAEVDAQRGFEQANIGKPVDLRT